MRFTMTTENLNEPIQKEDKRSVFIPDPRPDRQILKRHEVRNEEKISSHLADYLAFVTRYLGVKR